MTMNARHVATSAAKALREIDKSSFSWTTADRQDLEPAREAFYRVLSRNGYELVLPDYRIRKIRTTTPV